MSKAQTTQSTADVLEYHMAAVGEQDIEGFLQHYTDESLIVSNMGTYRGVGELRAFAEQMFEEFAQDGVELTYDTQEVVGDIAFMTWHGETPENVYEFGTDTFVIRDGVIECQTFAMKATPKN